MLHLLNIYIFSPIWTRHIGHEFNWSSGYVLIPTRDRHAFSIPVKYVWHTSTGVQGVARNKVTARLKTVKTRRECLCSFFSHFFIPPYRYGSVKSWTVSTLRFLFTCFIEMRPNKLRTLCVCLCGACAAGLQPLIYSITTIQEPNPSRR